MARIPRSKQMEIGKRVTDGELTQTAAGKEYKLSPTAVRNAVKVYQSTLTGETITQPTMRRAPTVTGGRSAFNWEERALKAEAERDVYQKLLLKVGEQL